jgi:hypothetical protein
MYIISENGEIRYTNKISEALKASENGAEIARVVETNPYEEIERLYAENIRLQRKALKVKAKADDIKNAFIEKNAFKKRNLSVVATGKKVEVYDVHLDKIGLLYITSGGQFRHQEVKDNL